MSHGNSKTYKVRSPGGEVYDVFNLSEFCRIHEIDRSGMGHVVNGRRAQCEGWQLVE